MASEQDVDRLSALPDDVICHILSFMPTKLSMKTSILAKRWRFLKLSGYYTNEFGVPTMLGSIVKFGNLTKLQFTADWGFLIKFLESADHLQELIIHDHEDYLYSKDWIDPIEERCACLLHSLRTVRINRFRCTEKSLNMVKFILRNAQVLERMEICPVIDYKKKFGALFS